MAVSHKTYDFSSFDTPPAKEKTGDKKYDFSAFEQDVKKKEISTPSNTAQNGSQVDSPTIEKTVVSPSVTEPKPTPKPQTTLFSHLFGDKPMVDITSKGGAIDKSAQSQQSKIDNQQDFLGRRVDYDPLQGMGLFDKKPVPKEIPKGAYIPSQEEFTKFTEKQKQEREQQKIEVQQKAQKVKDNFYNASLTPDDVGFILEGNPNIVPYENDYTTGDYATLINNKTVNLKNASDLAIKQGVVGSQAEIKKIEDKEKELLFERDNEGRLTHAPADVDKQLADLADKKQFIKRGNQAVFNSQLPSFVSKVKDNLKAELGDLQESFSTSIKNKLEDKDVVPGFHQMTYLPFDYKTNSLTTLGQDMVRRVTKETFDKENNIIAKAHEAGTGILDGEVNTNYNSISDAVIQDLNTTIPIRHNQNIAKKQYANANPSFKPIIDNEERIGEILSPNAVKSAEATTKATLDINRIKIKKEFENRLKQNTVAQGIVSKFQKGVEAGMMTQEIADKNIETDLSANPETKAILAKRKVEEMALDNQGKKMMQSYLQNNLSKLNPDFILNSDGSLGIKGKTKEQSQKLFDGYQKTLEDSYNKTIEQITRGASDRAEEIVKRKGLFLANFSRAGNQMMGGLTNWAYTNFGVGGDDARHYQSTEQTQNIDLSKTQQGAQWKGLKSLMDIDYYAANLGAAAPAVGGAIGVGLLTEGMGLPEYLTSLGTAGYFATTDAADTFNELLNHGEDNFGNKITSAEAGAATAQQFATELPVLWGLGYLHSSVISKGQAFSKPSVGQSVSDLVKGQGFNVATMMEMGYAKKTAQEKAQGLPQTSLSDYVFSDEGMAAVTGAMLFAPMDIAKVAKAQMKSAATWKGMLTTTTDPEFNKNALFNSGLHEAMLGKSGIFQDGLMLKLSNGDYKDDAEKSNLLQAIRYNNSLKENIRASNLDVSKPMDAYAAHNLSLADLYAEMSVNNKEKAPALSEDFKKKANDYKEEGQKALNGTAQYHAIVDNQGKPIFISEKSANEMVEDGTLKSWKDKGLINDFVSNKNSEQVDKFNEQTAPKEEVPQENVPQKELTPIQSEIQDTQERIDNRQKMIDRGIANTKTVENQEVDKTKLVELKKEADRPKYFMDGKELDKGQMVEAMDAAKKDNQSHEFKTENDKEIQDRIDKYFPSQLKITENGKKEKIGTDSADQAGHNEETKVENKGTADKQEAVPSIDYLKDEESTSEGLKTLAKNDPVMFGEISKLVDEYHDEENLDISDTNNQQYISDEISKEYHSAKESGDNPALVKAVEDILKPKENETKEPLNKADEGSAGSNEPVPADEKIKADAEVDKNKQLTGETKVGDKVVIDGKEGEVTDIKDGKAFVVRKDENGENKKGAWHDIPEPEKKENKNSEPPIKEPPPTEPRQTNESPKKEWTAVRKEKQEEIDGVKEIFDKQKKVKWTDTYDNAMSNVQDMFPDKSIYDAMRSRVDQFVTMLNNKILFNPTSEDIAVFNVLRNETGRRISEIQGLDSPDEFTRLNALAQYDALRNDLINIARVNNPAGEAGRAFNLLQSEISQDPEHGLQIRRMELLRAKAGEQLTPEEMEWSSEMWDKEKSLMEKEQELKETSMKENFDKQLQQVRDEYEAKLKIASQGKGATTKAEKTKKLLSQSGKEFADKIRSGKLSGTYATIPLFPQAINLVIESIAQIVEKGATLGEAIQQYIEKHNIKDGKDFTDKFMEVIDRQEKRADTYDKIKEYAEANKVNDVTNDMVSKKLITDYVDSHVGLSENKNVLDEAHAELKKILPDLTKERLREAYLKEGEFRQPTKQQAENFFKEAKQSFTQLEKTEKDINDLKQKRDLLKRGTPNQAEKINEELKAKEAHLKKILTSMGQKVSNEDKYKKATYPVRAEAHNTRIDELNKKISEKIESDGTSDADKKVLSDLRGQLEASKVKLNPDSKLSQDKVLEQGLNILKDIKRTFDKSGFARNIQGIMDKFSNDKEQSEQDVKLSRAKDKAKSDMEEWQRKLIAGEFEEKESQPLTKTDAEHIQLERQKQAILSQYTKKQEEFENKNKSWRRKAGEFARGAEVAYLIHRFSTFLNVGGSAILRPQIETATKLTGGKLFEALPFEVTKAITKQAKKGGESSSWQSIKKGYEAYFRQYGAKDLEKRFDDANDKYEKSLKKYEDAKKELNLIENKNSKEYKKKEIEFNKIKDKKNIDLIDSVGNMIFQYIGGSSLQDAWQTFINRTSNIEKEFGFLETENFKKYDKGKLGKIGEYIPDGDWNKNIDNLSYLMNFIGRSHAAEKTFSGRYSFAAGFMARLEGAVEDGVDITRPEKILEIANESNIDWNRGKYQESNWLSDTFNKAANDIEKNNPILSSLLRGDVAITRVPVNMTYEAVAEFLSFGIPASVMAAREYYKAENIVLNDGYTKEDGVEFKKQLIEQLKKIPPDRAAQIYRGFRKGGFGVGLYALAAIGFIHFGGFSHKGQTKEDEEAKKREEETGVPELKTTQVKIGDWEVPDTISKIFEHTPGFSPLFYSLGMMHVYDNNIKAGKTTPEAATNAVLAHIDHVINSLPIVEKLYVPLVKGVLDNVGLTKSKMGQWTGVNEDGTLDKRKAYRLSDYLNLAVGGHGEVLTEENYKIAVSIAKDYDSQIASVMRDANTSNADKKQQRDELFQEKKEAIDKIYENNKNNQ